MWHSLFQNASFFLLLLRIDRDLADEARQKRCPRCGDSLHSARYLRRPRGAPRDLLPDYDWRQFSLCCARDGCRGRLNPPSVRFLGRRVYVGAVVVLVSALQHGLTDRRLRELRAVIDPRLSVHTVQRWRAWWREVFVQTDFWKVARARLAPVLQGAALPGSLLGQFLGEWPERVVAVLKFLAPLNAGSAMG